MTARKAALHPAVAVLIPILLIAVYWATRFVNPTLLPIFNDEAQYLHWVSLINQGIPNLWVSLQTDNNKPLLYWLIASVWRYFDDPLSAGRAVSAIAGFFSMIGIYSIVCHLHSKWAGWIAAVFYIASPYHLFFDRLAHKASLLNCFFIWMIWLTILMLNRGATRLGRFRFLLMGGLSGLSLLAESTAVLFVFIPLGFKLIFYRDEALPSWKDLVWPYLAGVLLGGFPYLYLYFADTDFHVNNYFIPTVHGMGEVGVAALFLGMPKKAIQNTVGVANYFTTYLTWPVLLLAVACFTRLQSIDRRYLALAMYFILPTVVLMGTVGQGFSRYYLFCSTPLLIAGALGFSGVVERLNFRARYVWLPAILLLALFPALKFDHKLLTQPRLSPLVESDRSQYITGEFSGYGINDAVKYFKNRAKDKKIVLFVTSNWGNPEDAMFVYLDGLTNVDVYMAPWVFGSPLLPPEAVKLKIFQKYTGRFLNTIRISDLGEVYFICKSSTFPRNVFLAANKNFTLVESFGKPGGTHFFDVYKWTNESA